MGAGVCQEFIYTLTTDGNMEMKSSSRRSSGGVDNSERTFEVIILKETLEICFQGPFPGSCLQLPIRNQVYRRAQVDLLDAALQGQGFTEMSRA